jgi:probable phosphoglycerate mutase
MTFLALIRHGPTPWNGEGRIQGHSDIPLDEAGRSVVRSWTLPEQFTTFDWICSPLKRTLETARLLDLQPRIEPRLTEMDWGDWEGGRIADLRRDLGRAMTENEERGLDFRPQGGESPRDVQHRTRPLLAELGRAGEPAAAVTHKGVIRAIYALARGWDMTGRSPDRLEDGAVHLFTLDESGAPSVDRLNIPLGKRQ